jgi:hypothetical protein
VTFAILRTASGNLTNIAATGWILYTDDVLRFNGVYLLTQTCTQHTHTRVMLYIAHTLSFPSLPTAWRATCMKKKPLSLAMQHAIHVSLYSHTAIDLF